MLRDLPHRHPHALRRNHNSRPVALVVRHQPHNAVYDYLSRVRHVLLLCIVDDRHGVLVVVLHSGDEGQDARGNGCAVWGAELG